MVHSTPLADLIRTRKQELDLTDQALGCRLGYSNPAKAAGRVHALCNGLPFSPKSRFALWRLPAALEVPADVVVQAVAETERRFAERELAGEEKRGRVKEVEAAAWKKAFCPHAVIQTEHTVPSQITICGLTGGAGPRLIISLNTSLSPVTYVQQAVDAVLTQTMPGSDGGRRVMFFGKALGLIINYSPNHAVRCDLEGNPLEVLGEAYRIGEVSLSFGGLPLPLTVATKMFGSQ